MVNTEQWKESGFVLLFIGICVLCGFLVGLFTGLLGLPAGQVPGGSWGAGLFVGWQYPVKRIPLWYRLLMGGLAGILGWVLSLLVLALIPLH